MNFIWLSLIILAVISAAIHHNIADVSKAVFDNAKTGVELSIGLIGAMTLFLGLMKVAEAAGLVNSLARLLRPVFKWLFPDVPADHPALGSIALNWGANMLGLGDAATPMGLKAMQELQTINPDKDTASDAMCTFLSINSSFVQIIPVMMISLRAASGSVNPSEIILAALLATLCSTTIAVVSAKLLSRLPYFKRQIKPKVVQS